MTDDQRQREISNPINYYYYYYYFFFFFFYFFFLCVVSEVEGACILPATETDSRFSGHGLLSLLFTIYLASDNMAIQKKVCLVDRLH